MEKVTSSSSSSSSGSNGGGSSNLGLEMTSRSTSSRIMSSRKLGFEFENPFALKVGQVFTGFGIGCGVGIGVGQPLNLAAIPGLQQVMSATRGATDAFSGVGRHVNNSLKRFGAKNIQAGIGCGVGFGHGFGAGLAIKPGVVHRLQSCIAETMLKMMMKFGAVPGLSVGQNMLKGPLQSGMSMMTETSMQNPMGNLMQLTTKSLEHTSQGQTQDGTLDIGSLFKTSASKVTTLDTSFGSSRTEKVISNFLQNPAFKDDEDTQRNESAGRLRSESNVLQMVLKHQQAIEDLMDENEKLHRILIEELKVPPNKLQASTSHGTKSVTPCSDCFECRRRQRKHR